MSLNLEELKQQKIVLFEAISGSKAYGLSIPTSDTDYKGVFILPKKQFYGLEYTAQVSNETNDIVFYELKRFIELLGKNNPNLLEMLATPAEFVLHRDPLFDLLPQELFLSKLCKETFAGYAAAQIKKARGLNKKINTPMKKERKTILDFCWIVLGKDTVPLGKWLQDTQRVQEKCGLVNIPHARDLFALFYETDDSTVQFRGIKPKEDSNQVALSSIPKGQAPIAQMIFNKDGYQRYCKEYKQYWEWVEKRNDARYENTRAHGKNYDSKNMMHTYRLLNMAGDIAQYGEVIVHRPERAFLLDIRFGKYEYEELLHRAESKLAEVNQLFEASDLPDQPDLEKIQDILVEIRAEIYGRTPSQHR